MDAENWKTCKNIWVDEYGGEKVKETGMTDSEFFDWFKTGKRELEEPPNKLRALMAELHAHENAAAHNKRTVKII